RDPLDIARDVENGYVTVELASNAHAVVLNYDEETNTCSVDTDATKKRREETRKARLDKAIPVKDWINSDRKRVDNKNFVSEVQNKYKYTLNISVKFVKELKYFWNLHKKFKM